ncbi:FimV C-terminal domain [Cardiobacterium valvarum]|uniref:FimV C-terminal domain n=2 Tax=Cardiobacterium valvarum TaxID=194702 RepID=A0A381EC92_9GAMM|nr:FimV C-terminal domain [Cardiobacterium valvarum]
MVGSTLVIPDPGAATVPAPAKAAQNTDIAANDKPAKKEKKAGSAPGKTEIAKADIPAKAEEAIAAATPGAENNIAANDVQNPPVALVQNDAPAESTTPPENNVQMDGNQLTLDNSETLVADNSKAAESPAAPAAEQNPEEQSAALPVLAEKTVEVAAADEPAAPPTIPAMESKPVVAVVEEQPTDKVSTGMPLPLLAAAGVGVLGLGGAAAYFITHRRRRDDDSMEEFSQDEIDRMVSEMEAREGIKAGHDMEAGDPKPRRKVEPVAGHDPVADLEGLQQLNSQLSELEKLNEQIGIPRFVDDGEPHSAEELPDDFFKDLQLPGNEETVSVAAAPQPAAAEEEHDFFSDLEAFAAEEPAPAPTSHTATTDDTDFDLPDFGLDEAPAAATPAVKPSLAKAEPAARPAAAEADDFDFLNFAVDEPAAKAESASQPAAATDDDLDFLSFAADEPIAKEEPVSQNAATNDNDSDDFDFISFAAEEPAASEPVAAIAAQAAADDGDDFDFISFAAEEPAAPTAEETTATVSASTGDDDLDFFNSLNLADDSSASTPAAAAEPEIVDEDHNVLDFFGSDEEPAPVVAEEAPVAAEKPAVVHTHSVVSDAVVVTAPVTTEKAESEALDFFSLQDEPAAQPAAAQPASATAPQAAPVRPVAATIAPASSDIDIEAMEINLDMATSFIVMGKAEKARSWLDEVLVSGSEAQKIRARSMLEQLEKA